MRTVIQFIFLISFLHLLACYPLNVQRALKRFGSESELDINVGLSLRDPATNIDTLKSINSKSGIRFKRFVTDNSKWPTTNLYWKVEKYSKKLSRDDVDATFESAFKLWESSTNLKFFRAANGEHSHIKISFLRKSHGDAFPFDGPGGELAHAFYPNKGGEIHVDDDEPWTPSSSPFGRDLFPVATHEIGHALGLRHSSVKEALMYPEYKGKNEFVLLDQDDIDGIKLIYGSYIGDSKLDVDKNSDLSLKKNGKMQHMSGIAAKSLKNTIQGTTNEPVTEIIEVTTDSIFSSSLSSTTNSTTPETSTTTTSSITEPSTGKMLAENSVKNTIQSTTEEPVTETIKMITASNFSSSQTSTETSATTTTTASNIDELSTTISTNPEQMTKRVVYHSFAINEDICNDPKFDVVVVLQNGTAYSFKGTLYWRLNGNGYESGYPRDIENDWGIPGHLDAAYTDSNGDTYFFKGDKYWLFENGRIADGYPKNIANDFVQTPNNLDAVVQLDGKLYFFKGKRYWPYIEDNSVQDWPRDIKEISPSLTGKIDAGGRFVDGNAYLFSGHQYFKIEQIHNEVKIASGYPKPTGPRFFGCKS